jgi:hypothetical protein
MLFEVGMDFGLFDYCELFNYIDRIECNTCDCDEFTINHYEYVKWNI